MDTGGDRGLDEEQGMRSRGDSTSGQQTTRQPDDVYSSWYSIFEYHTPHVPGVRTIYQVPVRITYQVS